MNNRIKTFLLGIAGKKDAMIGVFLVAIIFMMILPLPTAIVDFLIAINLGLAATLLMVGVYLKTPLDFVTFPSVLLLITLFRLSLSITTTRLILLDGDAGAIIDTFGNFVVGGNLVVGIVIFLIITIVQFVVITKGSERVAEVSARFSLDAMPGKQMSIDSDLRANVINSDQARDQREVLQKESQLYGSMDGAMKFVKGDAIAGLIIIVVNILGGISIGTLQNGMSAGEALEMYAILTVGDGLIAQIPALFIAITAGIIVTRVTTKESQSLGIDISKQISRHPEALIITGGLMFLFAVIPGFPTYIFIILGTATTAFGVLRHRSKTNENNLGSTLDALSPATRSKGDLSESEEFVMTVPLLIDLSASLEDTFDPSQLNDEIAQIRKSLYMDLGVPFPGIHLRFNETLPENTYQLLLQETPIAQGVLNTKKLVVLFSNDNLKLLDIPHEEISLFPTTPTYYVDIDREADLKTLDLPYLTPARVLSYHTSLILKRYAKEFIGIQETRYLIEQAEVKYSELVKETQRILPIQKITEIFQRLVSEEISIRNLRNILEALVEWGQKEKETVLLTEYVRTSLSRYISYKFSNDNNLLPAYLLDQDVEDILRNGIRQTSAGSYLSIEPTISANLVEKIKNAVGDIRHMPNKPVIITSMDVRRYLKKLLEQDLPDIPVISFQELTPEISVHPLDRICL